MNEWRKDELRHVGEEINARIRFEHAFSVATEELTNDPPLQPKDILHRWTKVLAEQHRLLHVAAFRFDTALEMVCSSAGWESVAEWIPQHKLEDAVRRRYALRVPVVGNLATDGPNGQLLVSPCPGVVPSTSLAVIVAGERASLEQWMTQQAALSAALALEMLRNSQEREKGFRDMAARVSHVCASDLLLAQYRLRTLRKYPGLPGASAGIVDQCILDIEQAQKGFDRARLLGTEPSFEAQPIQFGPFIISIVEALCEAVADDVAVVAVDFPDCIVEASEIRLTYALRDLILTLWLIGKPRRPVQVLGYASETSIFLVLDAERPSFLLKGNSEPEWAARLRDPSLFLVSPDRHAPERILGMQLAWTLIEQVPGGRLSPRLSDRGLEMRIQLPARFAAKGSSL